MLNAQAPAKINLGLELMGKGEDGYHELVSVVQTVSLFDVVTFADVPGLHIEVTDPSLQKDNLVEKAARLLATEAGREPNVALSLEKYIPLAAGLGGGSSDAAATLATLNELWEVRLDCEKLLRLAEQLGSDVPFFLFQGCGLVRGRGERVRRLSKANENWYLLVSPGFQVRTGDVYAAVRAEDFTDGRETMRLAESIESGERAEPGMNALEPALFRISAQSREFVERLSQTTGNRFMITGSGPTAFAMFDTENDATQAAERTAPLGYWQYVFTDFVPVEGTMPCG